MKKCVITNCYNCGKKKKTREIIGYGYQYDENGKATQIKERQDWCYPCRK